MNAHFHEPWFVSKSLMHGPRPNVEGLPVDTAGKILEAWERCDENAAYLVWGVGLNTPGRALGLTSGNQIEFNGNGIIVTVYNHKGWIDGAPGPKLLADRIVSCVNSLVGVADPAHFVKRAREAMIQVSKKEVVTT
jgi:hypothetical protein